MSGTEAHLDVSGNSQGESKWSAQTAWGPSDHSSQYSLASGDIPSLPARVLGQSQPCHQSSSPSTWGHAPPSATVEMLHQAFNHQCLEQFQT